MSAKAQIPLRGARDRVIDLLGFGETYPLQDLEVRDEGLKVPFEMPAQIPIDPGQTDVRYHLRYRDEQPVHDPDPGVPGTDAVTLLGTPPIDEDVTYKILGRKIDTGREAYLHETATVRVGLDLSLSARILDAGLLDPRIEVPADTDPRIADYAGRVDVLVVAAQEGVDYHLVHFVETEQGPEEVVLSAVDVGRAGDLTLHADPVYEDTVIRIRATKTFAAAGRETESDLLEVGLPLKVRANPAAGVSVDPSAVAFRDGTTIVVAGSQESVSYTLYAGPLPDRDFLYGDEAPDEGRDELTAAASGEPEVRVQGPPRTAAWEVPEGYSAVGEPQQGTGGGLSLPLAALTEDRVAIVRARKEHEVAGGEAILSELRLEQAALVLVRPDPALALALAVPVEGADTRGTMEVSGGRPGVFYQLLKGDPPAELGRPAYFHQLDDLDAQQNKGVDQLRLEVDFVVVRDPFPRTAGGDPSRVHPLPPVVEIGSLPLGFTLEVRARKARTRLGVVLDRNAEVPTLPDIELEQEIINPGSDARIRVVASRPGEKYQPFVDGEPVKLARNGNGEDLVFVPGPLLEDTSFDVHVTRPGDPGHAVTRIVRLDVTVLDRKLAARILDAPLLDPHSAADGDPRIVDYGHGVAVVIDASEDDVEYRLVHFVDAEEVTLSVQDLRGNRQSIVLRTHRVFEDTEIRIRATRLGLDAGREPRTTLLDAVLPLAVRANPAVGVAADPLSDFEADVTVTITGSQESVLYTLYARTPFDRDFLYGDETPGEGREVLAIAVPGQPEVRVPRPPRSALWEEIEGFGATGGARPGTGGDLRLTLPALAGDRLVIVRARKEHGVSEGAPGIPSALQLERALLILVRPDPAPGIRLQAPVTASGMTGKLTVTGGQPGVFYHFRRGATGAERDPPAYFHQLDDLDPILNKGLEQLRIGVDFVVARALAEAPTGNLAEVRPPAPALDIGRLPLNIALHVRAVRARTRLDVPLDRAAEVPTLPEIRPEQEIVDAGAAAKILVLASQAGETYQPFLDGGPVQEAQNGNGADLEFLSGPLQEDTTFDVHVTRPGDPGIPVTRIFRLTVTVRPGG